MTTGALVNNILGPAGKIIVAFGEGNPLVGARKLWDKFTPAEKNAARFVFGSQKGGEILYSATNSLGSRLTTKECQRDLFNRFIFLGSECRLGELDEHIIGALPQAQIAMGNFKDSNLRGREYGGQGSMLIQKLENRGHNVDEYGLTLDVYEEKMRIFHNIFQSSRVLLSVLFQKKLNYDYRNGMVDLSPEDFIGLMKHGLFDLIGGKDISSYTEDASSTKNIGEILSLFDELPQQVFELKEYVLIRGEENLFLQRIEEIKKILLEQSEMGHYHYDVIFGRQKQEFEALREELIACEYYQKYFDQSLAQLEMGGIEIQRNGARTLYEIREAFIQLQKLVEIFEIV
ncbi:hypothetical protein KBB89_00540 [Candidatus Gracilibacteria bacterium]|nr:hypothetical protein [Candidatus Gracilibacteria bacterium]